MRRITRGLRASVCGALTLACSAPAPHAPERAHAPSNRARAGAAASAAPTADAASFTLEPLVADPPAAAAAPTGGFKHPVVAPHETRAVVLLYHSFDRGADPLSVSSANFRKQMLWLQDNQVEVVQLSQLVGFLRGEHALPARVAIVSMDDGMSSVYAKAWPILKELNINFSLGISTGLIEERKRYTMSWDQVREMHRSGLVEIASHGHQHRGLANLPSALVNEELNRSRELLEQRLGVTPSVYFYPLGSMNTRARELVTAAGYSAAFTATGAPIALGSSHLGEIPRTSVFHADSIRRFAWFFRGFLRTLPDYLAPKPPALPLSAE